MPGELAGHLTIGRPAVSKDLRVLEGAGLVTHQAAGTKNLYALAPAVLVPPCSGDSARRPWYAVIKVPDDEVQEYVQQARTDDRSARRGLLDVEVSTWNVLMSSR
jgi:DNA-binding transcriptional ArsR family regulator